MWHTNNTIENDTTRQGNEAVIEMTLERHTQSGVHTQYQDPGYVTHHSSAQPPTQPLPPYSIQCTKRPM